MAAASSLAAVASRAPLSSPAAAITSPPECPICTEAFECDATADLAACHLPRTLPCAHSVCSACLIKLLTATSGRVKCPSCRIDHALKRPHGVASPAAYVRLIPQNADIVQLIRRSAQLETALNAQQRSPSRCAYEAACSAATAVWCAECEGELCAAHNCTIHTHSLADHRRVQLSAKIATGQAKVNEIRAAVGARLKASLPAAVQQQKDAVAKYRQLFDDSQALLKRLEATAAQLSRMSDMEAQRQEAAIVDLLQSITTDQAIGADKSAASDSGSNSGGGGGCSSSSVASADIVDGQDSDAPGLLATLTSDQCGHLTRFLQGMWLTLAGAQLLYRATRDGFAAADLWQRCAGKNRTLTLVKVAGNGFICGTYTPVSWPADAAARNGHLSDPSSRTFLFSLVNAHGRAVKLRLKDDHRDQALKLCGSSSGPCFGKKDDLCLMRRKAAHEPQGCNTKPASFELDLEAETTAGLPPIPFAYDKTLLAGDDGKGKGHVCFAAAEIEVYQL